MICRCENCGNYFTDDEIEEKEICYEEYYGVSGLFNDKHYGIINVCPHCGSSDFEDNVSEFEVVELLNYYAK